MTDDTKTPEESPKKSTGKVALAAGAIGSAAIAAALLYAGKRSKQKKGDAPSTDKVPSGEQPETD